MDMAQNRLVVLLISSLKHITRLETCLGEITRWSIIMHWFPHVPLNTHGFDLCIIYHQYPLTELVWQLDGLPVVFVGLAKPDGMNPLEYIPIDQFSAFTLENAIRLLLVPSSGDRPQFCEQTFQLMAETTHDAMVVLSPHYKITAWNRAAQKLYGYAPEMVIGEDYPLLFIPPGDRQGFIQNCNQVLRGQAVTNHSHDIITKNGTVHRLAWYLTPLREEAHTITGIICAGRPIDLVHRDKSEETKHLRLDIDFSEALAQLQVGAAWFSCAGYLLQTNPIFSTLLGYTAAGLENMHLVDLLAVDDVTLTLEILQDIAEGKRASFRCELPYLKAQGDRLWLETTFTAVKSQAIVLLLVQETTARTPDVHALREHIHLTQILAQFSQILLNPDASSTLATALGLFGQTLEKQKVSLLQWSDDVQRQGGKPIILEQWSADAAPPCHEQIAQIPLECWQKLFEHPVATDLTDIEDVQYYPEFAPYFQNFNIVSLLALPLHSAQGKIWGYLVFTGDRPRVAPYSEFTLQTLQLAAELIHHYLLRLNTQRELEASESLYSGIVLHSAEAIFLLEVTPDQNLIFEMVNPTYCKEMNVHLPQVIGRRLEKVFPPELAQQIRHSCQACLQLGEAILFEEVLPMSNGEQIWRTNLIPIFDHQGKIRHIQGSGRNITDERQLELTKMRYSRHQHLLSSVTLRIFNSLELEEMLKATVSELRKTLQADRVIFYQITDSEWGTVVNESAIANVPSMRGLTLPITAFDRGDFPIFREGEIQTCIDTTVDQFPTDHHHMLMTYDIKSYAVLPILVSPTDTTKQEEPILKGLICIQQCHESKPWTADELRFLRQLSHQISIALNQAALVRQQQHYTKELARSNRELEQFAYIASHDLQEPLQIVSNYAQLLEKKSKNVLDSQSLRYIFHIVEGTKQMQQQIQDLLRYSRLNTRQKTFEQVDTTQIIDRAIATLQLKIKQSKATISIESPLPMILGDSINLQNLWQNLIGNAIKYAGDRPPEIKINCQKLDRQWLFSIQDNGIGIDPKYRERIFQIFQRLHTNEEYPGTGIGLAICQRIVNLHGGKIWVESNSSKGSTFFVTLPAIP